MQLNGGGKYDEQCERTLFELNAAGVLLIVLGGNKGTGFSMSAIEVSIVEDVPEILEDVARQIRAAREADKRKE